MQWIAEIAAHDGAGETVLRFADETLTTLPGDTPPNTAIIGHIKNVGDYDQRLDPQSPEASEQRAGMVTLRNLGGDLDYLQTYAIGGRAVTIYRTDAGWAEREAVFAGVSTQPRIGYRDVQIGLANRLDALKVPLQTTTYAGTTTDGAAQDAEAKPSDFGGKPKPLLFGQALNIAPPAVNTFRNAYQINDGAIAGVGAVRDAGVPLTVGTDHATLNALNTATIGEGVYDTCLALGYFRLGGNPVGEITCDATEGAALAPGDVAARILSHIGITDVDTASLTAYAADVSGVSGVWIGTQTTEAYGVLQYVLGSGGAGLTVTPLGQIRCVRITAPSGAPDVVATPSTIIEEGATIETKPVPVVWRVVVRYARYHQTQPNLAGAATAEYGTEWREVVAEDAAARALYPLATELVIETAFTDAADAQAFAADRLALHKTPRVIYLITQQASTAPVARIGSVAAISDVERLGLPGKALRVIGIKTSFTQDRIEWECWA